MSRYGQIYVPFVNWMMMLAARVVTAGFGSSDRLAGNAGTAVLDHNAATHGTPLQCHARCLALVNGNGIIGQQRVRGVDFAFFAANLLKVPDGSWLPLLLFGAFVFIVMTTLGAKAWRQFAID